MVGNGPTLSVVGHRSAVQRDCTAWCSQLGNDLFTNVNSTTTYSLAYKVPWKLHRYLKHWHNWENTGTCMHEIHKPQTRNVIV